MLDIALLAGRVLFLALLTVFLWQLYRTATDDLRAAARAALAPAAAGEPRLVVVAGAAGREVGRAWPLRGDVTIGRAGDNLIRVDDAYCSGHHARAFPAGGGGWLEDLGSTNGTLLCGRTMPSGKAAELQPGDEIQIGETVLRFER
ncbi:MAG: FHA domain-containing protein [Armatimonadetes bacterium]|nr:FHA domain-containing protein [Armatimonadota bacterium]